MNPTFLKVILISNLIAVGYSNTAVASFITFDIAGDTPITIQNPTWGNMPNQYGGWNLAPLGGQNEVVQVGANRVTLTNLQVSPGLNIVNNLDIVFGETFPGGNFGTGNRINTTLTVDGTAYDPKIGSASRITAQGFFQKNPNNINPGALIGMVSQPILSQNPIPIQGQASKTFWGGSGPYPNGYSLSAKVDVNLSTPRSGDPVPYFLLPNSITVQADGPPSPPDFFFVPPGDQLDSDTILDIMTAPNDEIPFDVMLDTRGVILPPNQSFNDILVDWSFVYDASEITLLSNTNPGPSVISLDGGLISTMLFLATRPGLAPHDGISDFGITLNKVLYQGTQGDFDATDQFPLPSRNMFDLPGNQYNQVVEVQTPEPATFALLSIGLAGLGFSRRKHP